MSSDLQVDSSSKAGEVCHDLNIHVIYKELWFGNGFTSVSEDETYVLLGENGKLNIGSRKLIPPDLAVKKMNTDALLEL